MILQPSDLAAFAEVEEAKAETMIADAEAMASMVAPCLLEDEFLEDVARVAQARAILRGAVLRWHESGNGARTQLSTPGFSQTVDTQVQRRGMFWPSEVAQLQEVCAAFSGAEDAGQAFAVDTVSEPVAGNHSAYCSLVFGAQWCSCGADLTRGEFPLYETDAV